MGSEVQSDLDRVGVLLPLEITAVFEAPYALVFHCGQVIFSVTSDYRIRIASEFYDTRDDHGEMPVHIQRALFGQTICDLNLNLRSEHAVGLLITLASGDYVEATPSDTLPEPWYINVPEQVFVTP